MKISMALFISLALFSKGARAEDQNKAEMKEGIITYTTTDTAATTGITWGTEGFTVKNKKTYGEPNGAPKGRFLLKDGEKQSKSVGNGEVKTIFTFPESTVEKQFDAAKVNAQTLEENGGNVYLNGIFQVYHGGRAWGSHRSTLNSIKTAERWRNPRDFEDRFDISLRYAPHPKPVYLTTMRWSNKKGYTTDKTKLIGYYKKRSFYSTTTSKIEGSYTSPISGKKLWLFQTHWSKLADSKVAHSNGTYRTMGNKVKTCFHPLKDFESYKISLQAVRNRRFEVVGEGIEIVCVYKNFKKNPPPSITPDGDSGENDYTQEMIPPYTFCVIQSNTRGNEIYNSEEAIPSSEYQYVNIKTSEYLTQYTFRQYHGVKYYKQKQSKDKIIDVPRLFSYWKIIDLNVYALSSATVENGSLPSGSITLEPGDHYCIPQISYQVYRKNLVEPVSGGKVVEEIEVRNDALYFNGICIMNGEWRETGTKSPDQIPAASPITDNTLYRTGLLIDENKRNGIRDSNALVRYVRICHHGNEAEGNAIEFDVENINSTLIHTPTICDAKIEDTKKFNQRMTPDKSVAGLVLDTYFNVYLPTEGSHDGNLKGYQTRDYKKFIAQREVRFPFDSYGNGTYRKAGTWISLVQEATRFYLPVWVKEGSYTVEFRSRSINCHGKGELWKTEELANLDYENYVAVDTIDVQVSGRLFGFNLYDISDYPIWRTVFRKADSLNFTNFNYTTGIKDRNGNGAFDYAGAPRDGKFTLPLVNGSHPHYGHLGTIKTGYYNRFSVRTMGEFDGKEDAIHIHPRFFYVEPNGKHRREVDLYYTEWFESDRKKHALVKIGSKEDKKNTHSIDRDDPYLGVRGGTAVIKESRTTWNFGNINLNGSLMLQSGTNHFNPQVTAADSNLIERQKKSVQTWFGEYYLPTKLYVCPKGFDLDRYGVNHGGLNFTESFWLKKGYIILNFEIEAIKDGEPYLSYINQENALNGGYCNMWQMEGGIRKKRDFKGNTFDFQYGDYVMYYADPNKSVAKDYRSGGIY
ncbi:MAG: DUF5704 domain-containing protein [Acetivibrio sp.]